MSNELAATEQSTHPMDLLKIAVENGADPDRLEKLLTLQERWEHGQAEKAFAAAMHASQKEMPDVIRNATNPQTKSKYAMLETVQKQCKPIYENHGMSLSYGEADCPREDHKRTTCEVRHVGGACHMYHLDLPNDGIGPKGNPIGGMNRIQGAISTTSYAQRRLVCMIFNITIAGEDTDGNLPVRTITSEQVDMLDAVISRIHPDEKARDRLLKWAGIESFDDLPSDKFLTAKQRLDDLAKQYEGK